MRKLLCFGILLTMATACSEGMGATNTPAAIPWSQIGGKAGADYQGDGLAVTPTQSGARLRCVFQRLDGEATPEGLWLTSTVTNTVIDRFRVTAMEVGRKTANANRNSQWAEFSVRLAGAGDVSIEGQTVRFSRPGLTEEYSVSMDGVRQDFIVDRPPPNPPAGELMVKLAVTGAKVEAADYGARLVLEKSGRKIAYSRLRVTDATGKELSARIEVCPADYETPSLTSCGESSRLFEPASLLTGVATEPQEALAVVVDDADAVYPVRIDPTFSDANWVSMGSFPGANGIVYASVVDGSGNVYIGGNFTVAGDTLANNVAEWNGSSWSALGSGMNSAVYALAVSGDTLYAGGNFGAAGGNFIAQWNGSSWSAPGSGMNNNVYALAVSGGTLYAGGAFTTAGGSAANYIAQWNGSSWSALGSGVSSYVNALAVSGGTLYAGGDFAFAGSDTNANGIAQWNGSTWSGLGSGMGRGSAVFALAVSGGTLYAGGGFFMAGGSAANEIARWNGSSWSALGSGMNDTVNALAVSGGTLYAGGAFTTAGGSAANYIAQWNGSNWSALGSGMAMNSEVYALAVSGSTLYAGGTLFGTGDNRVQLHNIAQWNGNSWSPVGSGMNSDVNALAVSGSTVYAGGYFTTAGSDPNANYIAQWNGSSWSALGSGMSGYVNALAVSGGTLYAGGNFTTAGSETNANHIAQWNGSSWSALASGMNSEVYALAVSGGTLYAGGVFTMAGDETNANYIAQWNGNSWSALGSGMNGQVNALAVSGGTLYAGGDFTNAGGSAANTVAQWNGSSWSALGSGIDSGSGIDGYVQALAVSGSTLYAGGYFTMAGGNSAQNIAQWNGNSWSTLGSGLTGGGYAVYALAVSGGTLYAGGAFTTAGGSAANYIAQWNGSSWSALGSGLGRGYGVYALAVSGGTLYAGGDFTTAGTNISAYSAGAIVGAALPNYTISVSASPTGGGSASGAGTFPGGSTQTVSAEANSGYAFVDWTENGTVVSSLANYTFTLNSNVALVANFTMLLTNASTLFGPQVQSTPSASITYNSGTGTFQYTDTANTTDDLAYLSLIGTAAETITSSNGWTASVTVNLSAKTMTATSTQDPSTRIALAVFSGNLNYLVDISLVQVDYTGSANSEVPNNFYGAVAEFNAVTNGVNASTTPLGTSQLGIKHGITTDSYQILSGGTNNLAVTESVGAATGILTLIYDAPTITVTGYFNGIPVGSFSLASWGASPPITLAVIGASGEGVQVLAGADTASGFTIATEPWVGTDDFSSGISANWTVYQQNYGQMLAVGTNQHLSFIVGPSATTEQNAEVVWNGTPAVSNDWTMDITGHNSASWSANGGSQLQLWVVNSANTATGYRIAMAGGSYETSGYQFTTLTPTYGLRQNVPATNADFGLRLVHRGGVAGDIEAWYDPSGNGLAWTLLDTMSMTAFWPGVVAGNTFTVAIVADTYYGPIAEGQLWADNFRITNSAIGSPLPQVGLAKVFQPSFALQPTFANLIVGTNYQLQVSGDLSTWTNQGSALTATNGSMVYPQYFNVATWNQLFFRLHVAP